MDVILIPTWLRPEYLQLCLEHIEAAGGQDKEIIVMHDRHTKDGPNVQAEIKLAYEVVTSFKSRLNISFEVRDPHPYIGNPCNFLQLYKRAYLGGPYRYIYLIEDDVLVTPDFFRWHETVQERGDYFCTVGWHCIRNPEIRPSIDPTEYIESLRDFSSIGVCWKHEKLAALVKHATPEFYQNMRGYLAKAFPGSPINPGTWTEQAGVITRLLHEKKDRMIAWPSMRRLSHVGVSGYHRPGGHKFDGPLEKRVADLREAHVKGTINSLSKDPFDDIDKAITIPEWDAKDLHVVQQVKHEAGKI